MVDGWHTAFITGIKRPKLQEQIQDALYLPSCDNGNVTLNSNLNFNVGLVVSFMV